MMESTLIQVRQCLNESILFISLDNNWTECSSCQHYRGSIIDSAGSTERIMKMFMVIFTNTDLVTYIIKDLRANPGFVTAPPSSIWRVELYLGLR